MGGNQTFVALVPDDRYAGLCGHSPFWSQPPLRQRYGLEQNTFSRVCAFSQTQDWFIGH